MSNLANYSNFDDIIEGTEDEIKSMMQECGLRPIDNRIIETQAELLEMIKYLKRNIDE